MTALVGNSVLYTELGIVHWLPADLLNEAPVYEAFYLIWKLRHPCRPAMGEQERERRTKKTITY